MPGEKEDSLSLLARRGEMIDALDADQLRLRLVPEEGQPDELPDELHEWA